MAMHEGEDEDDDDVVLEWWAGAGVGRKRTPVKRDADQPSPTTSHSSKEPSPKRVKQEGAGMSLERQDQSPPRPKKGRQSPYGPNAPAVTEWLKEEVKTWRGVPCSTQLQLMLEEGPATSLLKGQIYFGEVHMCGKHAAVNRCDIIREEEVRSWATHVEAAQ